VLAARRANERGRETCWRQGAQTNGGAKRAAGKARKRTGARNELAAKPCVETHGTLSSAQTAARDAARDADCALPILIISMT